MGFAVNGQAQLYFETFGADSAPTVMLCGGTGRQSIDYDDEFCGVLVGAGYRVIRFDSRDVGLSTSFAQCPSNLAAVHRAALGHGTARPAYSVADMAMDALAVMDATQAKRAHVVGRSLGGAVAQSLALAAPGRIASLTLIMTNSRSIADHITPETVARVEHEVLTDAADYVARQIRAARINALPEDFDSDRITTEALLAWQRGVHAGAIARHFAAAIAMPDLRQDLHSLDIPATVLHGTQDQIIPPLYAQETAAAIPGARLKMLEAMGHDGAPRVRRLWLPAILDTLRAAPGPSALPLAGL